MTFNDFQVTLTNACEQNSIPSPSSIACEQMFALLELLIAENKKYNLTAITSPEDVIYKHFADCLLLSPSIAPESTLIDVGCGAGFPSLPLAILRPDLRITPLDSTGKKIHFIELASGHLGLKNITPICGRAEEIARKEGYRDSFDVATARAVASFPVLCELCLPYVRPGGRFIAMKGRADSEELTLSSSSLGQLKASDLTLSPYSLFIRDGSEQRTLVFLNKIGKSPDNFPRKYAQISKNPLK